MSQIEVDLIDAPSGEKLRMVHIAAIPRVGEEMVLDLGEREGQQFLYRVVRVLYHVRPRKIVRTDDLIGIALYVERLG